MNHIRLNVVLNLLPALFASLLVTGPALAFHVSLRTKAVGGSQLTKGVRLSNNGF